MQSLFKQHFKRMSPKAQQCVSSFWAAGHVALTPASVLAPSPLLWQNIRPTGNSRKKECILVDGSRRVQGLDGEGGGEAGNWEATLSITQRKQSKGDQLARPPFKFHNAPQNYLETKRWDTCASGGHCSFKALPHAVVSVSPVSWFYIVGIFT